MTSVNYPDWKVISSILAGWGVTGGVGVADGAEEQPANSMASRKIWGSLQPLKVVASDSTACVFILVFL
jgi:hypothetical protein